MVSPPKFYKFNPSAWFKIVEAHLRVAKIKTRATKFDHVLLSLDPEVAAEIDDFLADRLCDVLRKCFTLSEAEKLKQLENLGPLGEMKPSQLLREMQRLNNNQVEKSPLLEIMFFSRLPAYVRQQVKRANLSLNEKADLADELIAEEISGNQNHTFAIAQPVNKSESFSDEEIYAIRQLVQKKSFNKKQWNENNRKTNDPQMKICVGITILLVQKPQSVNIRAPFKK